VKYYGVGRTTDERKKGHPWTARTCVRPAMIVAVVLGLASAAQAADGKPFLLALSVSLSRMPSLQKG
jgi:hypothetical protein